MPPSLNRRTFVTAAMGGLWVASCARASISTPSPTTPSTGGAPPVLLASAARPQEGALRAACRARGIRQGAARDTVVFPEDAELDRLMAQECDLVVPENGGKWAVLQPRDGVWDWRRFDRCVQEAKAIGAAPVWHCMLWQHNGMPNYMKLPLARRAALGGGDSAIFSAQGTLAPDNYWSRFTDFAGAVRARYGDAFYRIDVANEVFFWETPQSHPNEQDAYGLRKGSWWMVAGGAKGPEWLDPFFHHARQTFPSAKLVINEFGVELAEGWQQRKRAYLLRWLTEAVKRGVPIDGLGLQSHLTAGKPYDREGMRQFLRAVDRLGVAVHITELDVDERQLPRHWSREEKDRVLAWTAREYLRDVVSCARLVEVTWWHLRSDLNWIGRERPDLKPHPAPFDAASQPLPLYDAAIQALAGTVGSEHAPTTGIRG